MSGGKKSGLSKPAIRYVPTSILTHLTARYLARSGPVDEMVYPAHVDRSHRVQLRQHFQGFKVMVAFYHGNEGTPPAAGEADVCQGLLENCARTSDR